MHPLAKNGMDSLLSNYVREFIQIEQQNLPTRGLIALWGDRRGG